MATLAEIRQQHPEYSDLSDRELAERIHARFYSDIPYEQFAQRAGAPMPMPRQMRTPEARAQDQTPSVQRQAQEEIAARAPPPPPPRRRRVDPIEDVVRSGWVGVERGAEGFLGLPGEVREAARLGADTVSDALNIDPRIGRTVADLSSAAVTGGTSLNAPTSGDLADFWQGITGREQYEPQTTAGEYARTVGEFAGAGAAPGSLASRVSRVVVPAVASEAPGQAFEDTPYEMPARLVGGIGGGVGTELAIARTAPAAVMMARVEQELLDAGLSPSAAQNVGSMMRAGAPQADIQAAIAAETGGNIPFERMPNLARQMRVDPSAEGADLERRIGPMTSGERSRSVDDRLQQTDFERADGRPRAIIDNFNNQRAPIIAENTRRIATRGLPAQSLEGAGGAAAADDLREVFAMVRDNRRALYTAADEAAVAAGPINHNRVGNDLIARAEAMVQRLRLRRDPAHERWLREFEALQDDIQQNRATWQDVHVVRTQLNEAWGAANPADRRIIGAFKRELDNFREAHAPTGYRSAIENADTYSSEMSQMFGRRSRTELGPDGEFTGTNDIAGRRIEEILNTDIDSRTLSRMLINENGVPSRVGVSLARRLRQINDDLIRSKGTASTAESGQQQRLPGRIRIGNSETVGSRGFSADETNPGRYGVEQPTRALQAVREMVLDELVLSRLAARTDGQPIPAQAIATRLRNALSERGGREMMRELFTEAEMAQLDDVLRYFERLQAPTGASVSGTPAGMQRMMADFAQNALRRILGPVDRYVTAGMAGRFADNWAAGVRESRATANARRITERPSRATPTPPPVDVTAAPTTDPVRAGVSAAMRVAAPRLGETYLNEEEGPPLRRIGEQR